MMAGLVGALALARFRRRRHTLLDAFGATNTLVEAEMVLGGRWSARLIPIARRLFGVVPGVRVIVSGVAESRLARTYATDYVMRAPGYRSYIFARDPANGGGRP